MNEEKKCRILVFEFDKYLASGIRDILELENYIAIATEEPDTALLALESFCPDIVTIGYYGRLNLPNYEAFLERCHLNYPILYFCFTASDNIPEQLYNHSMLSAQDRIIGKPFDADEMLLILKSLHPFCYSA